MLDTCTVKRATGEYVIDPESAQQVPEYVPVLTGQKCRVKLPSTQPHEAQVPGQTVVQSGMEWHVPMSVTGVRVNDIVTLTAVDPVIGDAEMIGRQFRVVGPFLSSAATARRFPVEVVS